MALLLGQDGQGYDLARKLESLGVWRTWLGDTLYSSFIHCLTSPSSWDVFMTTDDSKSRAQILLQLRVRALLFDKLSASQFLRPSLQSSSSSSSVISKLNPNYLQLHGDDIYFSYEDCPQDELQQQRDSTATAASKKPQQKSQSKASSVSVGSRYGDKDMDNLSQRLRQDEFPETWYNQFFEKYRVTKPYRIASADQEGDKRTPERMSSYIITNEKIKKRRAAFREDETSNAIINRVTKSRNSILDETEAIDDDSVFFPEIMFPFNCVPSSTFPPMRRLEQNRKIDFNGILDSLPKIMTRNPTMIERLGIRPENMGMEQQGGGNQFHGKAWDEGKRRQLSEKQASEMSRKVIARNLAEIGFDGSCKTSVDVLSQLLSSHTCKLGRVLRMLADNYRKKCSAVDLVKMFLQTTGYSNLGGLAEIVKDSSRNNPVQQTQQQQQLQLIQSHLHPQFQAQLRQPQQVTRQMQMQMQMQIQMQMQQMQQQQQQMAQPQNLVFQQQQQQQMERIRRRQPAAAAAISSTTTTTTTTNSTPRPMVQVKLETPSEFTPPPMETGNNTFGAAGQGGMMNIRHPHQLQFQQHQQIAAMSNFQAQSTNQFRPSAILSATAAASHLQIPLVQTPNSNNGGNSSLTRAQPVKVEGFQELMGGDLATIKLDNNSSAEGNGKITSPPLPQPPK